MQQKACKKVYLLLLNRIFRTPKNYTLNFQQRYYGGIIYPLDCYLCVTSNRYIPAIGKGSNSQQKG